MLLSNLELYSFTPDLTAADASFGGVRGFSRVIGALDGTHIPVSPPKENRDAFINRKGWASINVMLVCTHDCRILAVRLLVVLVRYCLTCKQCVATHPGSCSDSRIYRESGLPALMDARYRDYMLLADSGYPGDGRLLTPYKRSKSRKQFSKEQEDFNALHARARVVIEHVNGQLKVQKLVLCFLLLNHAHTEPFSGVICTISWLPHPRARVHHLCCSYAQHLCASP